MNDSTLSVKNASGKTFSLLNENNATFPVNKLAASLTAPLPPKRKYHCNEPGCNKSFTTSGHLARHHRIHTGEKNFHCLHPGCPSRFSRQDNMMQHYRTHLSQKARRQQSRHTQKKTTKDEPELYRHTYHGPEDRMSFQPLIVNRPKRSATMPSMPYPSMRLEHQIMNRHCRARSTSSSCSSSPDSSFTLSPPQPTHFYDFQPQKQVPILPPPFVRNYNPVTTMKHPQQQENWNTNNNRPFSNLLHLANIVSTFG